MVNDQNIQHQEMQSFIESVAHAQDNLVLVNHSVESSPAMMGEGEDHVITIEIGVCYTNAYNLEFEITLSHIGDNFYDSAIKAHNNDWASLRTIAHYLPQALGFYEQIYGEKFPLVDN